MVSYEKVRKLTNEQRFELSWRTSTLVEKRETAFKQLLMCLMFVVLAVAGMELYYFWWATLIVATVFLVAALITTFRAQGLDKKIEKNIDLWIEFNEQYYDEDDDDEYDNDSEQVEYRYDRNTEFKPAKRRR